MARQEYIKVKVSFTPIEDHDEEAIESLSYGLETEELIFQLKTDKEVQLLLLRFMGYDAHEIIDIMHLRDVNQYYSLWRKLRKSVKKLRDF